MIRHALASYRPLALALAMLLVAASAFADDHAPRQAQRPNIIIILADDMGFSDIGCYGGEIRTPHLDALAHAGLRFTQFYNTGRCCPTRASLLTGLYPHQAGIGHMTSDRRLPGYQGDLNDRCLTIAQVLKTAGYATYMAGKWHVTKHLWPNSDAEKHNWPLQRGFDRFFGTILGAGSFYDPTTLVEGNEHITPGDDFYYTDAISDHAVKFIREHDNDKPFFMYVAYTAAHWPMHARPRDIAKYKGAYDAGYGPIREARFNKMRDMGLLDQRWELSPQAENWDHPEQFRAWEIRCMEAYAAMVDAMDQGIGRIVDSLKNSDQLDNTLILYLQDNGGCAEGMGRQGKVRITGGDPDARQPMKPGELQRDMIPKWTRDGKPMRQGVGVMPGPADTYIGYGRGWANVSNTPFREYKHWVHEGGAATPLIAHWPNGIPTARHGQFERQPGHLIDLMATCVDLAGATYPTRHNGKPITPMQGVSLRPAFLGQDLGRTDPIFNEHEGNRSIRIGQWKLVAKGARGPWELYDMQADRSEMHDLADKHPDRAQAMADRWEQWALDAHVKPWPWTPNPRQ